MAKSTNTEVAKVEEKLPVAIPSFMDAADFGGGFEGTDKDSYAIPFLQILQKMSPMVDEDNPKYVDGAKAGMLYNTVTGKLYDGKAGIIAVPCAYKRSFIQWAGRDADGGFKGEFTPEQIDKMVADDSIKVVEGRMYKPESDGSINEKKSDYFADTRSHYILILDEETGEYAQALFALAGSQVKASKALMTSLQQKKVDTPDGKRTPPTYANRVRVTTIGLQNEKGSWSGAKFDLDGLVTNADVYNAAKEFYKAIIAGSVNVDFSKADAQSHGDDAVSDKPKDAEGF